MVEVPLFGVADLRWPGVELPAGSMNPQGGALVYDHDVFVQTISEFVRNLIRPYDVDSVLNDLSVSVNEVLSLAGSGVSLVDGGIIRMVSTVPPELSQLERHQEETQQGPCVDAFHSGEVVAVDDITNAADRWPGYCDLALRIGVNAVAGIPLELGGESYGALNLYARRAREWTTEDLAAATVMANIATGYLINASTHYQQEQLNDQLRQALESRVVIEQAKGIIAEAYGLSVDEAFERMRRHARRHNAKLRDVAGAIVRVGLRM